MTGGEATSMQQHFAELVFSLEYLNLFQTIYRQLIDDYTLPVHLIKI